MYNIILVPLDGSRRAETILPHVKQMALRYDAAVVLTQVVVAEPVANEDNPAEVEEKIVERTPPTPVEKAEAYLTTIRDVLRSENIDASIHVGEGPVVETIIRIADHVQADLIAIASHGRTGLGYVFYGSVVAGVLHRVDRPLLIIRSV